MNAKQRLYRDGVLSGCSVAAWMLATVGVVHYTALWTAGWGRQSRMLGFAAAAVAILGLALAAAAAVYLVGLHGPPEHIIDGDE